MRNELARQAKVIQDTEADMIRLTQELEGLRAENEDNRVRRQEAEEDCKELESEYRILKQKMEESQGGSPS